MRKSRLAALAAVTATVAGLFATGAGTAGAQQVCDASSFAGGEACF
ncbi:MAG TPA: hypothetical protein VGL80_34060 [Pseudonocardiaceae bacterium]